ncbi:MAG: PIN domain-containing protein [Gemmatimonadota bacterium]
MTVLADSGCLYAMVHRDDAWHERTRRWWEANAEPVLVPVTVIPEVTYMLAKRLGVHAEQGFVRALASGELPIESLEGADIARAADLIGVYADLPLGFVDASIVAMAERLDVTTVLTTDRRDFGVVRPAHCERLRLVP